MVLITSIILGTVFGVQEFIRDRALRTVLANMQDVLYFSRLAALQQPVVLHALDDNWSIGANLLTSSGASLGQWRWQQPFITVTWHGFLPDPLAIILRPTVHHNAANGHFLLDNGVKERKIFLNRIGKPRVE